MSRRGALMFTPAPAFPNSEVGLMGDQAILAWRISRGSWNGVKLDGLSVVGVAKASATIGDEYSNPYPAKAVLIFDERGHVGAAGRASLLRALDGRRSASRMSSVKRSRRSASIVEYLGEHPKPPVVKGRERRGNQGADALG